MNAEAWQSNREREAMVEEWVNSGGGWRKRGEILENCDVIKTMLNDTQSYFRRHNLETHSFQQHFFLFIFVLFVVKGPSELTRYIVKSGH